MIYFFYMKQSTSWTSVISFTTKVKLSMDTLFVDVLNKKYVIGFVEETFYS